MGSLYLDTQYSVESVGTLLHLKVILR